VLYTLEAADVPEKTAKDPASPSIAVGDNTSRWTPPTTKIASTDDIPPSSFLISLFEDHPY